MWCDLQSGGVTYPHNPHNPHNRILGVLGVTPIPPHPQNPHIYYRYGGWGWGGAELWGFAKKTASLEFLVLGVTFGGLHHE